MSLVDQICTPPALPPYLKKVHDLKIIRGIPEDEEMIQIHAVIRMAEKVIDAPEVGNPMLLYQLTEHLFNVQMVKYRSRYLDAIFPESTTYTPPTLPTHISVSLGTITGTPSDEEIIKVQDAIRLYQQCSNIPSMFDPRVNMELSQHLFDLQIAKYTQRMKQNQPGPTPREVPNENSTILVESTAGSTEESNAATNNAGTAANITDFNSITVLDIGVQNAIEQSNRIAEQANLLIERSNQIAERSNQVAERSNQLVERLNLPSEQSNNLTELYERLNQNSERSNQHQERTNYFAEGLVQKIENIGDVLKNMNKVLAGIQHAIVRNHKGNKIDALDCLINDKGETPPVNEITRGTLGTLSRQPNFPNSVVAILIDGAWTGAHIANDHLGGLLWFYGIGDGLCENGGTQLKSGKASRARQRLGEYFSSCLG